MCMCKLKTGGEYKGWSVLDVFDVPDYHSTAVYLRHTKTGLEVFHLLNDDDENLFSFTFRTPCTNARGIPHILEHSVLCGSEKYPLKDPFLRMSNQSVKTYLNASTYPDHTVFPASSMVKADYFHLMSVYGDAVFFPLLRKEIFMQEAHRLDLDENGRPSIQGVVYNEMKGSYSSFEAVAADEAMKSVLRGSIYEKDSGGDPLEIPNLTYKEFVSFHKKHYRPDNCFVFLYGNIPTEEQLDFIQKEFLDRIQSRPLKNNAQSCVRLVKPHKINEPVVVRAQGPSGEEEGESGATVLVNWNLGPALDAERNAELLVLAGVLMNHDGSPLQKALIESGLGEDIAPETGLEGFLYESLLTIGLRGVKKGDERKIEKLIISVLKNLVKNGIPQETIDSTMMSIEYEHREIKRIHGPFALSLMNGPIHSWMYGESPAKGLRLRSTIECIRSKLQSDSHYLQHLINELLLKNNGRSLVIVTPSSSYARKRIQAEQKIVSSLFAKTSLTAVEKQKKLLTEFQQKEEDGSCLPNLKPSDFLKGKKKLADCIKTDVRFVPSYTKKSTKNRSVKKSAGSIPLFINSENTNGIVYFDIGFPTDVLPSSLYPLLPLFAETAADCGWDNLSWAQTAEQTALHTGGISISLVASETPQTAETKKIINKISADARKAGCASWCSREWVVYRIGMIEEEAESAMSLLSSCITGTDFHDIKRLKNIAYEFRNDVDSSIIPSGSEYALMRTKRTFSRAKAIDEIWNGVSSLYKLHELTSSDMKITAESFRKILRLIRRGGAFIHITGEKTGIESVQKVIPAFVEKLKLGTLQPPRKSSDKTFFALTELPCTGSEKRGASSKASATETLIVPAQVGYAAETSCGSSFGTNDACDEEICAHWLSNTILWEQLRTVGGAYGAYLSTEPIAKIISFSTYRDPSALLSCGVYESCLRKASARRISREETERAIIGTYSSNIQPRSPHSRGATGLLRALYAMSDLDREKRLRRILSAKPADVMNALSKISTFTASRHFCTVVCGKSNKISGKFVILPL